MGRKMDRLTTWEPWPAWLTRFGLPEFWEGSTTDMRIEEIRDGDEFVIRVEMPGIDPERDLDVSVQDGVVHVHAERTQETHDEKGGRARSEFHYGSFDRHVALPPGVDEEGVTASYRDGIVEVRVPLGHDEPTSVRKVPVTRTEEGTTATQ